MHDWIVNLLESLGYFGIFTLMVLEHLFPPIPSELIMPLAGFISSSSSEMGLGWVILVGTLGSVLGMLVWYLIARSIKYDRLLQWTEKHGRWIALKPKDIQKATDFFQRSRGYWVVGAARIVPGVRTYVSVPAGLSHMPWIPYLLYSAVGTALWTAALAIAGYFLGENFERVSEFIAPLSKGILIGLAGYFIYWMIRRYRRPRL